MTKKDDDTEEPLDDEIEGTEIISPHLKGHRRSFQKVRPELTEEELGSTGVQKMMLDELNRLDGAEIELKATTEKYHETNTKLAIAGEKLKTHNAFDVISTGTVAVGSLLFGAAFSLKNTDTLFWILLVFGGALVAVGIAAKVMRS